MVSHEDVRELLSGVSGHLLALAASRVSDEATALDIAQEVLLKALMNSDGLRRRPNEDARHRYLAKMVRNQVAEVMRRSQRHLGLPPGEEPAQSGGPYHSTSAETWRLAIWDCVQMLSEQDRWFVNEAFVKGRCATKLGRKLLPDDGCTAQFRKGRACLDDVLLQLRIRVYRDSTFFDAFHDLYDGTDPYWTLYRPARGLNGINTFPRAIRAEEATSGEETLVLGSVSSMIIPGFVQEARVRRILRHATPQSDRRMLQGPLREVLAILEERSQRFQDRVRRVPVTHIACKETIERMVRGGWCSAEHTLYRFGTPALLTAEEGQASVEEAIRLLTKCPNFRMGLADREQSGPLFSVWKVVGEQTVLLETWRDEHDPDEVDVVIREEGIAKTFRDHFHRRWRALPGEGRDRKQVIRWLKGRLTQV